MEGRMTMNLTQTTLLLYQQEVIDYRHTQLTNVADEFPMSLERLTDLNA